MKALVIGGTRNLGPSIVENLVAMGFKTAVFHRGVTQAAFGPEIERLYGDRGDEAQLRAVIGGRDFDVVIDTTLYTGSDAEITARVLRGRAGRYIALSTGQVYLVRTGPQRPFREEDYDGPVMPEPADQDLANWRYGVEKRAAEDAMHDAGFPAIWFRMPMVNSERDPDGRIAGYLARLRDGGPILIPEGPHLGLRHLYGEDAVAAVCYAAAGHVPLNSAWNLSQDEELSLNEFLRQLAELDGHELRTAAVPRQTLEEQGLLPMCSPFSGQWMSALDNTRWKTAFGWRFMGPDVYLPKLVEHYAANPQPPEGYGQRAKELAWCRREVEAQRLPG